MRKECDIMNITTDRIRILHHWPWSNVKEGIYLDASGSSVSHEVMQRCTTYYRLTLLDIEVYRNITEKWFQKVKCI